MSDREAQAAFGKVFKLLAQDPTDDMKRLAAGLYLHLRCDRELLEADEALLTLGLLRIDRTRQTGDVLGRTYGPAAPSKYNLGVFFPPIIEGGDERGRWRWRRAPEHRCNAPRCQAKQAGYRGCTATSWLTVYLPSEFDADRPHPLYLCGTAAEMYLKDHPEAVIVDGYWRVTDADAPHEGDDR